MNQEPLENAPAMHQIVKLTAGKHASARDGACVMELSSMLAGESFSDRPAAVSPIVAAFLRAYNDSVDDDSRQELYGYAAKAVGTVSSEAVERRRAQRCLDALHALRGGGLLARLSGPWSAPSTAAAGERLAERLARDVHRYLGGRYALALADELIAMGRRATRPSAPSTGARTPALVAG